MEVCILEYSASKIERACGPRFPLIALEVSLDDPDDGLSYFLVILPIKVPVGRFFSFAGWDLALEFGLVVCPQLWGVWQPQVATEHIDALLPFMSHCFVGNAGHGIHPCHTDSRIRMSQLAGCGTEPLHEATLLNSTLPPVGDDEGHDTADTRNDRERELGEVFRLDRIPSVGKDPLKDPVGRESDGRSRDDSTKHGGR
jgi:hypothetical protein